jgi:hypothetical protein
MPAGLVATQTQSTAPVRSRAGRVGGLLVALLVLTACGPAAAQPVGVVTPAERADIQRAIDKGVEYLKQSQNGSGSWGTGKDVGAGGGWAIGYTALAGLTLIECGIPTTDKYVKAAASVVRQGAVRSDSPYELALSILFIERMGDTKDRPLIQLLATRLILGQTASGGWSYKVPTLANPKSTDQILDALRKMTPAGNPINFSLRDRPSSAGLCIKMSDDVRPKPAPTGADALDPEKAKAQALARLPKEVRQLPVFRDTEELPEADPEKRDHEAFDGTSDNSNTHFATLGLWAARRHDVPTERTYVLLVRRWRTSQLPNGSWPYHYKTGGGSAAMTAVALLGLAIGHVLGIDPQGGGKLEQDPQVLNGLKALSNHVGDATGEMKGRPAVKDSGGLYFFWAMERIAVLYDLRTLGNKDWYRWGAEILVSNQRGDGSWSDDGGYPGQTPILNTCFALLFLKRANLTPDLSRRLAVDSSALTDAPIKEEPTPPVESGPSIQLPSFQPVQDPEPTPPATTPRPTPPPAETPSAPKEERPIWPWLLGLLLLLIAAGVGIYFAMKSRKDDGELDEEEDGKARKRKRKVRR